MKRCNPASPQSDRSAATVSTLWLTLACFSFAAFITLQAHPSWWDSEGAIHAEVVTTNSGVVTTNYAPNSNAVVNQGQLKQFTVAAYNELNATLANSGGAGPALSNLVYGWRQDYATNNYNSTNNPYRPYKPSDFQAVNVGQLKYIASLVYGQLYDAGYTGLYPSWIAQNTNTDHVAANLGQLKEVFNFDLTLENLPEITSQGIVTGAVNLPLIYSLTATQSPTSYSASGLPPGLSLNSTTGVITGTPTVAGVFSVEVVASNTSGNGTGTLVFNIVQSSAAPVINSATTSLGSAGMPVSYQITASNNPIQFAATNLPSGLSINLSTGVISGTVASSGTYTILLSASNGAGTGTATLTLAINSGTQGGETVPIITSSLAASSTAGQSFEYDITATNNPTSYGATGLPDGLSIDSSTGVISGTPTNGGTYSVLISATNASGTTSSFLSLTIAYTTPSITSNTTATAAVGTTFTYAIGATNNPSSYFASGLPAGLTLSTATGIITGTPTTIGTYTISLSATNSVGTGTATLTLTVAPQGPPVITSPVIAYAISGQSFSYQISATGNPSSFAASNLPAGLNINTGTGMISGTLSSVGTPNVTVSATNGLGQGSSPLIIVVEATSGSVIATLTLQDGVSPSPLYTTTSAGIGNDTSTPAPANGPLGQLVVGTSSSTESNRTLLGFDLSAVPAGATITSASLALQGTSSYSFNVELYQASGVFSPTTASWNNNSSYNATVLSTAAITDSSGPTSWASSSEFVSAVQAAINAKSPLDFMLVSPDAESSGEEEYVTFTSEGQALGSYRPALTLNYTTSAPPVVTGVLGGLTVNSNTPYTYPVVVLNSPTSYSATGLPSGLSFNTSTGVITGTVTATGTYQVTISASNANGTGSTTFTMTVVSGTPTAAPVITSPTIAYATAGTSFSYNTTVENGPVTFSAAGLPSGFSIDSGTGVISGTPTSAEVGTPQITITATNAAGSATATLLLVVQSNSSSVTVSVPLQDGVSPTSTYQTISAGIATDTGNSDLASSSSGPLAVGKMTSTQTNRAILGFDLSVLPPGATVTSAQLILNAEASASSSSTTYPIEIHAATGPLSQLSDVQTATWTNDSGYNATVLSSLTTTLPSTVTQETWPSSSSFVSATQNALNNGTPLFFMLVSPTLESGTTAGYFIFDNEGIPYNPPTASTRPILLLTYTTSAPPVITGSSTVSGAPGSSFSYQIGALNGATSYSATGLPNGLSINSSTGLISGTPSQSGTFTGTIYATNGNGTSSQTVTFNIGNAPAITSATSASATVGSLFSYTITASNLSGTSPVYTATSLPAGLTLNPSTGVIAGTPTSGGYPVSVTIGVTTLYGSASANLTITFVPVITGTPLTASGNTNDTFDYYIPTQNDPANFMVTPSDGLSSLGLSINSYGNITGTPTAATPSGGNTVTITASNAAGSSSASLNISIAALPVPVVTAGTAAAVEGHSFTYYPQVTVPTNPNAGNISVSSYSATGLPGGLSINPTGGSISGTPTDNVTQPTNYNVTILAIDAAGTGTGTLTLTLYPPGPGINSLLTANTDVGSYFYYGLTTIEGDSTSTSAIGLPPGMTYTDYGNYGEISGQPTTPGTYNVTLSATDSAGISTATLVITIGSVSSATTATAEVGVPFTFTVTDNNHPTDFQASNLPQGLSINSTTGVISGTPVAAQAIPVYITVTDAGGSAPSTLQLTINPNPNDNSLSFQQGVSPTSGYTVPSAIIKYDSQNPATANQTFATGSVLTVGQTTTTAYGRALLGFDLSALPANAVITSAALVMNTSSGNSSGQSLTVYLYQTYAPLVASSATWNSNNGYNANVLGWLTLDPAASPGSNTFPINPTFTQTVQQAYNGGSPLYLILMAPEIEGSGTADYIGFVTNGTTPSQNPQLVVTYEISAPTTPSITSATAVTGTVNVPLTYTVTASNNSTQFAATGLPSGLSLNTSTGVISGTVTAVSSTVATVSATNTAGTGSQAVTFNIDSATPATSLTVVSGNNQLGLPSTFLAQPLVVQASYNGTAIPSALVTFSVPAGEGAFSLSNTGTPTANTITTVTNGSGQASVYFFLPQSLRTTTVIASAGTAAPVNLVETSAAIGSGSGDQIAVLSVISGEGQSGPAGQTLSQPFVVQANSASGQPVASQSLILNVTNGGGEISSSANGSFGSSLTVTTNGDGEATIYLQPGGSNGTNNQVSCAATSGGSTSTVYLTAQTSSVSVSSPAPAGGTPPATDADPMAWNGYVQVAPTDFYDGSGNPDPDPTTVTIWWGGNTQSVTGYLVEKKVSTSQWTELATEGAGSTTCQDSGLQANEEVQYRVTPYIKGVLGNPSAPVGYSVPLIAHLSVQTKAAYGYKPGVYDIPGFAEFTNPSVPPKYYLTETNNSFYSYGNWYDDGYGNYGSSGGQSSYNSTQTAVPVPTPNPPYLNAAAPEGYLAWTWTYSAGTSQYSNYNTWNGGSSSDGATSSENAQGQWTGSYFSTSSNGGGSSGTLNYPISVWPGYQVGITQTTITYAYNSPPETNSYSSNGESLVLSNLYSTQQLEQDVNNSLPDYGTWQPNYYGWGWYGGYGWWGFGNYGWLGWWIADRDINPGEWYYNVSAARYKYTAYAAKDENFQWAEVLYADDPTGKLTDAQRTSVVDVQSWTINSSSESDSSPYELNPVDHPSNFGSYYLAPVPQLYVVDDGTDSYYDEAYLDSQEKVNTGESVPMVNDPNANNVSGGTAFSISNSGIPGATYTLSWNDNDFQVWGYNYLDDAWEQVTSGTSITLHGDADDEEGWSGSFVVVATQATQSGEQMRLNLSSEGPDGTTLGTDSSLFTYTKKNTDLSVPIDEASGTRYRKIALNGLPMADAKPQQSAENDQEKEETYVDALTLGLKHSTTDVYMPVSGSDFSVSARRDFRSQVWNNRHGLRPHEQPNLPFGIGWSSNLAPNIQFSITYDPSNVTQPDQAVVTDETGAVHSFYRWWDSGGHEQYFPMPTAKNEAQVPNLETLTVNTSVYPYAYTFKRKYGETLTFTMTAFWQTVSTDRLVGAANYAYVTYQYARLTQAVDRVGNTMNYQFQNATDLIPVTITVANQPGIKLSIAQTPISTLLSNSSLAGSVITAIWDGNGNKTSYGYSVAPDDSSTVVLTSVTAPDGTATQYSYSQLTEADLTPKVSSDAGSTWYYVDMASITDPLGHTYAFTYNADHSKFNYMSNTAIPFTGNYIQSGSPRNIATVTMPESTSGHPDVATFVNNSSIYLTSGQNGLLTVNGPRVNRVTDATGFTRTYTYGTPDVVSIPSFPQLSGNVTESKIVAFQSLTISYGNLGSESFVFDINAAMALKQITDFSGNVTSFAHANAWSAPSTYTTPFVSGLTINGYYDDPTSQTNALGQVKSFTYDSGSRIMTDVVDENQNHTHYDLDSLYRRTTEKIYNSSSGEIQETDFTYGNNAYPGFTTQKTIKALGGSDPSWVQSLVTQYVPDANGRIAQEIVDPNGLHLVTTYTYDANGNKLTATDSKGQATWFSYDFRNRLVTTTFADGTQKQFIYDARGNKTAEYDENGIATLYNYDALSRLVTQARDMNGNGVINPGTDLVTSYTYNNVNSKLSSTDPNGGTTTMAYDNLQRVMQITDPLSHSTQFTYGANSGGNAFDSSSFKPTQTVDPRGFATDITYDALYRPVTKAVQYSQSAAPSTTSTVYDPVGNPVTVTDPLGHQTRTTYDALNRPLVTTYADGSTSQQAYTSTGLKWQVIDENGNKTQTAYDNASRPTSVTQGYNTSAASTTTTAYDAANNVAETVNPLGNKWDYVYDARNRKLQELEPSVVDAVSGNSSRPTLSWKYDPAGRVAATIDARGNETDMVYDPANRVTDVNAPAVPVNGGGTSRPNTHSTYDFNGNVLTLRDPNSHTTTNTYDALNRLLTTTDALTITVTNTYDQVGNKLTVKDGRNQTTTFTYDGLNRLLTTADAAGDVTTLAYDVLNKTQRTDALGQVTNYLYDVRNRLGNVVYNSTTASNSQRNYAYDSNGNLLSVTEPSLTSANVAYTYDPLNRVLTEKSNGQTHSYTYDTAGNRTQTIYGVTSRTIASTYDALNRLGTMTETGRTTTYGYDLTGNIARKTLPNGDQEVAVFDALNRMSSQTDTTGSNAALYAYAYGYDLVGNLTGDTETYPSGLSNRTVTNTYDNINRLQVEAVTGNAPNATTTYAYDNANNRTSKIITGTGAGTTTYSYNSLNELTSWTLGSATTSYTYDADGNRLTRSQGGATDTYSYDFENRLIGLVKNTTGGAGTYAYSYDYRTRRIGRDESQAGGNLAAIVFSGGASVQEYTGTITSAHLQVEYLRGSDYGGGVGGILYTIRGSAPSYTHANKRGDIVAKTDGSGNLTYQAQYAGFGNQTATNGSTLDRQKSNSKDTDPTNLVDEGMRYRDLETGEFITRDPAGFVDGPNMYTYVQQNPWTKFDPEGLFDVGPTAAPAVPTVAPVAAAAAAGAPAEVPVAVAVGAPVAAAATGVALGGAIVTEVVVHENVMMQGGYAQIMANSDNQPAALPPSQNPSGDSQKDTKAQTQTATSSDNASGGNKPPTKVAAAAPEEPDKNQIKNARQKGVADMWKQEAENIKNGNPSRKWTAEQEQDILAGRVPKSAADGKPVEGAHVESVKEAPEKAGDPNNIKPKSFTEHRAANGGEHSANPKPYDTGPTTTP